MIIRLTRLNGANFFINPYLIEKIETTPNTVITMTSQTQYIALESVEDINNLIISDQRKIFNK